VVLRDVHESILLWTLDPAGARETWTLDGAGDVASHTDGARVAARGGVWLWRQVAEPVPTRPCPSYDANGTELPAGGPSDPGAGVRVTLEREGRSERIALIEPEDGAGAQDIQQSADLVASVGPFLFIRESTYAYTCGAHGNVGASARIYDVEHGTDVVMPGDDGGLVDSSTIAAASNRARVDLLRKDDFLAAPVTGGELPVELTAIVPTYDRSAALEVGLQFTTDTCYACSDGAWSSYTTSVVEAVTEIPVTLRPWASPPASVLSFVETHPGLNVRGWGRVRS
jgi:hypothetical protein